MSDVDNMGAEMSGLLPPTQDASVPMDTSQGPDMGSILSGVAPTPDASAAPLNNPQAPSAGQDTASAPSGSNPWAFLFQTLAAGLSGGAKSKNFATGLGNGVDTYVQQDALRQKQAQDAAQSASTIKFQTAQAANMVADTALRDAQLHNLPQEQQDAHNAASLQTMKDLEAMGVTPTLVTANNKGGAEAKAGLEQLTNSHGGVPPLFTINLGDKVVGYDLNKLSQTPQGLNSVNQMRQVQGLDPIDPQIWAQTPKQLQVQQTNAALGFYNPDPSEQTLAQYQNYLDTAKSAPPSPDRDATVAKLQAVVSRTQGTLDAVNTRDNANKAAAAQSLIPVEAQKAAAVAKAQLPYELAKTKAEQAVKDGDPAAAGQLLASGDVAPSQIISARNPAFAQQAFNAAKKADPNWNAQQAEGYFKAAGTPANVTFFGSAKSLTDKGGTLDQLATNYKDLPNGQIPALNKVADWTTAAAGSGATAKFAQTAIGVADDYAKVMGGGQGSDSARNEVLKSFSMAHSPSAMAGAIQAARDAVASQTTSRIGSNPVMKRMYGDVAQPSAPKVVPAGAIPGRDAQGNIIGYKGADGKVVTF